ncbi:MAG: hypothetical protein WC979_05380 [Candidatus Pacearchaeota archaeon]|jgi:hypothetical protein
MNKTTFCLVLESALLSFDGVGFEDMTKTYGINEKVALSGIKLCSYLKNIDLPEEEIKKALYEAPKVKTALEMMKEENEQLKQMTGVLK